MRLRLILLFTVLLLLQLRVHSQENVLLQYSNMHPVSKPDSAAIIQLIYNSQKYEYRNIDTALTLVDEALRLSRERNFTYGIGNAYIAYSVYATTRGQYSKSDSFLKKAYPYCVRSAAGQSDIRLLVLWHESASIDAAYRGDYIKSVSLTCAAMNLINQRPNDTTLIKARTRTYNAIGSMLLHLGRSGQAIYYLDKGLTLAAARKDNYNLAQLYVNFGSAYGNLKQPALAEDYFQKAIAICKKSDNTFTLQVAYLAMATMYRDLSKNDTAIACLKLAIDLSDKTNPYMAKVTPYLLLGEVYLDKKDYQQSIRYGESALDLAATLRSSQQIMDAHALLASAYSATGQWQKAYGHQFANMQLRDSVRSTTTMANISQLEIKSRVAEKDIELARQQLSLTQKESALKEKNFWIAGILAAILLLAALLISVRRSYRHKQKLQESAAEVNRLKAMIEGAEQERKRIATELHDGVVSQLWGLKLNLTTTINKQQQPNLLQPDDFKQSLGYLDDAMNDLRNTAHNLSPEMALQAGLVKGLSGFCNKMNNQSDTDVVFQVYGESQPTDKNAALSIFRIVQELVQNALKHARASSILVQLNCAADILGITVQDDGQGFDTAVAPGDSSMGLNSITDRIKALHASMDIQSSAAGTSIYMEFKNRYINNNSSQKHS
jgi:signal transduction histidine kinase